MNAAGIATINALAPGRTFFGVGAGNTAMRVMGQPPHRIREFDRYLATIAPLLKGEEGLIDAKGETVPIVHIMPDKGFVNFADPIPMYVSGFGPKSLALAGKYGDGAVIAAAANQAVMTSIFHQIAAGAEAAGRVFNKAEFYTTGLTTIGILEPGEAVDSDRIKSQCGAMAMAAVHYNYDQWRNFGHQPPGVLHGIWEDYTAMLAAFPEERRHQRIHAGHNCWVIPEEARFLTPDVLKAGCMIGTRDQIIDQLAGLHAAGLDQVMILPNFDTRFEVLDQVGKQIIGNV